jgi:3-methyladenine DNA glycosylase AlkD
LSARSAVATPTAAALRRALRAQANADDATQQQRYFKTGPGEYAEGDRFLGVRVPAVRTIVQANRAAPLPVILTLLRSKWHEERLLALLLMVERHRRGDASEKQVLFDAYVAHLQHVNNWDLVDTSAPQLIGAQLGADDLALLEHLAASTSLWERRIAMLATFHHIRQGQSAPALHIAELLHRDPHPLLQKAVGWMLREIGERDRAAELRFLDAHWREMPRTAVRYAIEHFPKSLAQRYSR